MGRKVACGCKMDPGFRRDDGRSGGDEPVSMTRTSSSRRKPGSSLADHAILHHTSNARHPGGGRDPVLQITRFCIKPARDMLCLLYLRAKRDVFVLRAYSRKAMADTCAPATASVWLERQLESRTYDAVIRCVGQTERNTELYRHTVFDVVVDHWRDVSFARF